MITLTYNLEPLGKADVYPGDWSKWERVPLYFLKETGKVVALLDKDYPISLSERFRNKAEALNALQHFPAGFSRVMRFNIEG